jgi:hypothetical protein
MTIHSVDLMWSRQLSNVASPDGKSFTETYQSTYQVVHDIGDTDDLIKYAPGIQLRQPYSATKRFIYCTDIAISSRPGPILSFVDIKWVGESVPGTSDDPTNQKPVINYYSATTTEPVDTDGNGFPLTNVNGDVVEGFTTEISDMVLEVSRNYRAVSGKLALRYLRSTNSDTMNIFGDIWEAGSAALQGFRISPVLKDDGVTPEYFQVNATMIFREAYNTVPARAWYYRYRNEGLYERVGATVTFSGGGGSGAAAYAITTAGAISAIVVTNRGIGYTSAPSVAISTTTTGAGASATATVNSGEVTSVAVGSGGSGYKGFLVRAVDTNKEPVTKPVLLKVDGQRQYNAGQAVFLERPKKNYSLPYNALGLL